MGRGRASLRTDLDTGHRKPLRSIGRPLMYSPAQCLHIIRQVDAMVADAEKFAAEVPPVPPATAFARS